MLNDNKTGGPAFPAICQSVNGVPLQPGMTLRDYFAAKAMQGYITSQIDLTADDVSILAEENVAAIAYQFADAMLAAREQDEVMPDNWTPDGVADLEGIAGFKPWTAIHLKTGNEYRVIGEAIDATNAHSSRPMVIYEREGRVFVRCSEEFMEKFKATADGWIEWKGGECPVAADTFVEIEFRNGDGFVASPAHRWERDHDGTAGDIIAYRVVESPDRCVACFGSGKCAKPAILPEPPDVQCPVCRGTGKGGAK